MADRYLWQDGIFTKWYFVLEHVIWSPLLTASHVSNAQRCLSLTFEIHSHVPHLSGHLLRWHGRAVLYQQTDRGRYSRYTVGTYSQLEMSRGGGKDINILIFLVRPKMRVTYGYGREHKNISNIGSKLLPPRPETCQLWNLFLKKYCYFRQHCTLSIAQFKTEYKKCLKVRQALGTWKI